LSHFDFFSLDVGVLFTQWGKLFSSSGKLCGRNFSHLGVGERAGSLLLVCWPFIERGSPRPAASPAPRTLDNLVVVVEHASTNDNSPVGATALTHNHAERRDHDAEPFSHGGL
jgi:hypothetical protein